MFDCVFMGFYWCNSSLEYLSNQIRWSFSERVCCLLLKSCSRMVTFNLSWFGGNGLVPEWIWLGLSIFSHQETAIKHSLFECSEISICAIPAFILEKLWAAGVCPGRQWGTYRQRENHMLLMVKFKGDLEKLHVGGYRVHWQNTANREPRTVLLWGNDCAVHC